MKMGEVVDLDLLATTQTMGELNIDQKMLDSVLQAVSSSKEKSTSTVLQEQTTTLRGKGFSKSMHQSHSLKLQKVKMEQLPSRLKREIGR